jgi:hypothetical protein
MNACIYQAIPPLTNTTVMFTAGMGTTHCMDPKGSNANITVNRQGVICASIGYIEADVSCCTCDTDYSYWGIGWETADGTQSGSANSWITKHSNWIGLQDHSANTYVCGSAKRCSATGTYWPDQGPLYVSPTLVQSHPTRGCGITAADPRYRSSLSHRRLEVWGQPRSPVKTRIRQRWWLKVLWICDVMPFICVICVLRHMYIDDRLGLVGFSLWNLRDAAGRRSSTAFI